MDAALYKRHRLNVCLYIILSTFPDNAAWQLKRIVRHLYDYCPSGWELDKKINTIFLSVKWKPGKWLTWLCPTEGNRQRIQKVTSFRQEMVITYRKRNWHFCSWYILNKTESSELVKLGGAGIPRHLQSRRSGFGAPSVSTLDAFRPWTV